MANETLVDVFAHRINVNADPTSRTGAFNTGETDAIESSTNASPIEITCTGHTFATGDTVFIHGHLTNTSANGVWVIISTGVDTFTLTGSVGVGVGGATGTVLFQQDRWLPVFADGFQVGEKVTRIDANTEHKDRGPRYSWPGNRNRDAQQISTPVFPEFAKFLLDLPVDLQSGTQLPKYYGVEEYWDNTLATGTSNFRTTTSGAELVTGRSCLGLVFDGWDLSFDRESEDAMTLNLTCFMNAEYSLTSAFPTIPSTGAGVALRGWPQQNPYRGANVYIDLEFAIADETFSAGWTGDRLDLQSASIKFSQNIQPALSRPSSTASLSGTWTKFYPGKPTLEFQSTLTMSNSDYIQLTNLIGLRKARVRFMGVGDNPSGSTTSATNLSAAGTTVVVASNTGFHVGDVILLEQVTAGKQQVVQITAIAGTTFTVTAADVAMDGSGAGEDFTVRNTAFQIKVPSMDLADRTPPTAGGNVKVVSLSGSARLTPTTTTLFSMLSYNDDFAGYPSA